MKPANKSKRKLNKREAFLIAVVLMIALILIVWQVAGRNLYYEIALLSDKNRSLSAEIANLEEFLSQKDSIESKWPKLQEDEAKLNKLLPAISELPSALGELEKIVESYENQIKLFQAGEIESGEGHISLPFTLNAEGSPYIITAIIKTLEAFPQLLVIDYLRWTSINEKDTAIDMNFRIHFYNDLERGY